MLVYQRVYIYIYSHISIIIIIIVFHNHHHYRPHINGYIRSYHICSTVT